MTPDKHASTGKIIFDMDGVITGESCYWDAAALVLWELFYAPGFMGLPARGGIPSFTPAPSVDELATIRNVIFQDDAVISFFKRRALNSNWDLAFLSFAFQVVEFFRTLSRAGVERSRLPQATGEGITLEHLRDCGNLLRSLESVSWHPSYQDILKEWAGEARGLDLMERVASMVPAEYEDLVPETFKVSSRLWKGIQRVFQEWYFGDEQFNSMRNEKPIHPGKEGLIYGEMPVLPEENVRETLEKLRGQGWILGIATGRPYHEIYPPLNKMNLWNYFHEPSIATFTDVELAESRLKELESEGGGLSLGKPHPFSFLKAYWSGSYADKELASEQFPKPTESKCWVIGDALADLLAARKMGARFIGVLTGHNGQSNELFFKREGAQAVFPDITHLPDFFSQVSPL